MRKELRKKYVEYALREFTMKRYYVIRKVILDSTLSDSRKAEAFRYLTAAEHQYGNTVTMEARTIDSCFSWGLTPPSDRYWSSLEHELDGIGAYEAEQKEQLRYNQLRSVQLRVLLSKTTGPAYLWTTCPVSYMEFYLNNMTTEQFLLLSLYRLVQSNVFMQVDFTFELDRKTILYKGREVDLATLAQ